MQQHIWLLGAGAAALVVGCSGAPESTNQTQPAVSQAPAVKVSPAGDLANPKPQNFPNPVASPTATVNVPTVPGLLQPTSAKTRVAAIAQGRQDPFATVSPPVMTLQPGSRVSTSVSRTSPISLPKLLPPLKPGVFPGQQSPNLTALPPVSVAAAPPGSSLPSVPVPITPLSKTSLADGVEVTGAVQVRGKWMVIVKESGSPTSRYVSAGDYLANGSVLVKRIIAGNGADPIVVLQQNGIEVMKPIGGTTGPLASR